MSEVKQRDSNIELLRILSMLIIVIYHLMVHGIIPNSPAAAYITKPIITVLHIGVVCFVLISGYWRIRFTLRSFLKIFIYCSFYSILIYLISCFFNTKFSLESFFKAMVPQEWWFIPVYLCLFLLTPFINIPLLKATRQKKLFYIILLTVVSSLLGIYIPALSDGKNPINFILIYYIGNYIRTELRLPMNYNASKLFGVYLLFNSILFAIVYLANSTNTSLSDVLHNIFFHYNSIGLMVNAILFFLVFTKLKIQSNWINWLASSSLSVYLIHESLFVGGYLYKFIIELQNNTADPWLFTLLVLLVGVFVFMLSILIDKIISPIIIWLSSFIIDSAFIKKLDVKLKHLI